MVKIIGALLIGISLIAFLLGAFIDINYGSDVQLTGNAVTNIINQPDIDLGFMDYAGATMFAFSVIALIMGLLFLFRVASKK